MLLSTHYWQLNPSSVMTILKLRYDFYHYIKINRQFKLIAPPHYKCECYTLDKVNGIAKLETALQIIEKEIKEKQGTFKIINEPQVIGAKDDKDIIEIMDKINDEKSSGEEDNDEGMGDLDIDDDEEGEEKKEEKKASKKSKKAKGSDDEDEDEDDDDN